MSVSPAFPGSSQGHFLVATTDSVVYARVVGLGNMNNSVALKRFLDQLREKGYEKFIFDLEECSGFDSTFMGILLGLALAHSKVVLVNVNGQQSTLLADVGICYMVTMCEGPVPAPDISLQPLAERTVDQRSRLRVILESHENLVRLDERNQKKFQGFLTALRHELGSDAGI